MEQRLLVRYGVGFQQGIAAHAEELQVGKRRRNLEHRKSSSYVWKGYRPGDCVASIAGWGWLLAPGRCADTASSYPANGAFSCTGGDVVRAECCLVGSPRL